MRRRPAPRRPVQPRVDRLSPDAQVDFDGEEAQPLLLLLRNNVTFVRSQLLPSTAETLLTLLRVLQPMRSARRSRQRSAAAPAADLLLPSSEAYQLVRQELRQLAEELLATYCAMKASSPLPPPRRGMCLAGHPDPRKSRLTRRRGCGRRRRR